MKQKEWQEWYGGCQWDATCKYINTKGDKKNITDSDTYGNYFPDGYIKKNTGGTAKAKTNNIYDLAGNVSEWTQEANSTVYRAYRGGNYSDYGSIHPVSMRESTSSTTNNYSVLGTRPVLILNSWNSIEITVQFRKINFWIAQFLWGNERTQCNVKN